MSVINQRVESLSDADELCANMRDLYEQLKNNPAKFKRFVEITSRSWGKSLTYDNVFKELNECHC